MAGALFVVATPIGHLGDITQRAVETLRDVDRIVAEDTRRTRALLSHLGIAGKPVDRFDANASPEDVERIVAKLEAGERVAQVSDAGTPVVSDPGHALVRAAAARGIEVVPIPGASAVMAAVSVSGLVDGPFRFVGFMPRSGEARREAIAALRAAPEAVVLFEAPSRTQGALVDLAAAMPDRHAMVARELTKLHEELMRGTLAELAEGARDKEWLGEVTIVLGAALKESEAEAASDEAIDLRIDAAIAEGRRAKEIAEDLAFESGRPKREIYARVLAKRAK